MTPATINTIRSIERISNGADILYKITFGNWAWAYAFSHDIMAVLDMHKVRNDGLVWPANITESEIMSFTQ